MLTRYQFLLAAPTRREASDMNTRLRTILPCSLSVFASVVFPMTGAAQPAYSVIDLGKAPEPVLPEPYNQSSHP